MHNVCRLAVRIQVKRYPCLVGLPVINNVHTRWADAECMSNILLEGRCKHIMGHLVARKLPMKIQKQPSRSSRSKWYGRRW